MGSEVVVEEYKAMPRGVSAIPDNMGHLLVLKGPHDLCLQARWIPLKPKTMRFCEEKMPCDGKLAVQIIQLRVASKNKQPLPPPARAKGQSAGQSCSHLESSQVAPSNDSL